MERVVCSIVLALTVFLLNLLSFEKDYARVEDKKKAKSIDGLIYLTYQELGYKVIRVPILSIEKRSHFILDKLGLSANGKKGMR